MCEELTTSVSGARRQRASPRAGSVPGPLAACREPLGSVLGAHRLLAKSLRAACQELSNSVPGARGQRAAPPMGAVACGSASIWRLHHTQARFRFDRLDSS